MHYRYTFLSLLLFALATAALSEPARRAADLGYLKNPPVFLTDEQDIALTTFAAYVPTAGKTAFCSTAASPESDGFVSGGVNVQPYLSFTRIGLGVGVTRGITGGRAVGLMVPGSWTRVGAGIGPAIGALPASSSTYGMGGLTLFGKKAFRMGKNGGCVVATVGLELPTGKDDATFDQSNAVTNAYYRNSPRRMPIAWQASNGATNGSLLLSYGRAAGRISYQGLIAAKINGAGDEGVRLGNVLVAAVSATCGVCARAAASLELAVRSQKDDDYPNAPTPGVSQAALAGTTTHGTTIFVNPSVRFSLTRKITVGVGMRFAVVKPDDGMVPRSRVFLLLYPNL